MKKRLVLCFLLGILLCGCEPESVVVDQTRELENGSYQGMVFESQQILENGITFGAKCTVECVDAPYRNLYCSPAELSPDSLNQILWRDNLDRLEKAMVKQTSFGLTYQYSLGDSMIRTIYQDNGAFLHTIFDHPEDVTRWGEFPTAEALELCKVILSNIGVDVTADPVIQNTVINGQPYYTAYFRVLHNSIPSSVVDIHFSGNDNLYCGERFDFIFFDGKPVSIGSYPLMNMAGEGKEYMIISPQEAIDTLADRLSTELDTYECLVVGMELVYHPVMRQGAASLNDMELALMWQLELLKTSAGGIEEQKFVLVQANDGTVYFQ